jgi:glycosyltransferase involved in cell wall biosynthesis
MKTEVSPPAARLPTLSIITPSFNQACFIQHTIESVLGQNYPGLEYIIIDGGSTDGTLEILKKYQDHVRWTSEKDHGQSEAINKGFQQARGEILAYLNSDDCYEPGALIRVGNFFMDHPQTHWLTGKCRIIDEQGREIRRAITAYKNLWLRLHTPSLLLVLDYISQPATFWRRDVVERVGLFDVNEHYSMDYDYSLRVLQHYRLWVMDHTLAAFRVHPGSKSGQIRRHFATDLEVARRYSQSALIRNLHAAHNALIVAIYEHLQPQKTRGVEQGK